MKEIIIELHSVSKEFNNHAALKDCSLCIEKGKIYGVVGPNGAGKTTLFRLILGLGELTKGRIIYDGKDDFRDANISFGALIERPYINNDMTAFQNLKYMSILGGDKLSREDIINLLDRIGLGNEQNKKVKKFSLGMKQRLGISMAVINSPDVLILDEPMNGLDPEGIIDIRNFLLSLQSENDCTIIISSHILCELDKIATNYIFIKDGKILLETNRNELDKIMEQNKMYEIEDLYMNVIRGENG